MFRKILMNTFDKINPGTSSNVRFTSQCKINTKIFSLKCFCKKKNYSSLNVTYIWWRIKD